MPIVAVVHTASVMCDVMPVHGAVYDMARAMGRGSSRAPFGSGVPSGFAFMTFSSLFVGALSRGSRIPQDLLSLGVFGAEGQSCRE
jgi:hypothetical protein